MNYAIVRLGGKQFKVVEGDTIMVESQQSPIKVEVLAYAEGEGITLGSPLVSNVTVEAEIVGDDTVKTRVARYKSKSNNK